MRSSKLFSAIVMMSMVATPVLAATQTASVNPAAALALPSAGKVRISDGKGKHSNILGLPLIALLAAAAVATTVVVVATNNNNGSNG